MKYCEKCGSEIKEGFAFCDKCGAKVSAKGNKKEKKEKEVRKIKEERPVPPMPPMKSKGKGKIIILSIINVLLLAATITFLILWLTKSTDKNSNSTNYNGNNENTENGNNEKPNPEPSKKVNQYVGKWEQNVEYKEGSKVVQRTYGLIELKNDETFRALFYDKDDISGTKEEIEGDYIVDGNEIIFKFESNGSYEKVTYYVEDDKLCLNEECDDYLVKDSYNNKIVIQYDSNDTKEIKTINYTEYENLQKNYKDAIVVIVKDGCSWCEKFESVVLDLAEVYDTPIYYYKHDGKISISGTPTTIVIKNGYPVDTIEGYKDYSDMVDILDELGVK